MVLTVSKTFFQLFFFFNRLLALKQLLKNSLLVFPFDNYDFSSKNCTMCFKMPKIMQTFSPFFFHLETLMFEYR